MLGVGFLIPEGVVACFAVELECFLLGLPRLLTRCWARCGSISFWGCRFYDIECVILRTSLFRFFSIIVIRFESTFLLGLSVFLLFARFLSHALLNRHDLLVVSLYETHHFLFYWTLGAVTFFKILD